jgi:hypothetical protein
VSILFDSLFFFGGEEKFSPRRRAGHCHESVRVGWAFIVDSTAPAPKKRNELECVTD